MLTQERYQTILELLNEKDAVTVSELSQLLDTSESTIRRDLNALDEMGRLKKVFGGATTITRTSGGLEANISSRETVMNEEKEMIAKYSATLINDSDFVFIDSGTTTSKMIDYITNTRATFVTNGITQARKLLTKGFNAYMLGGKIKSVTEAVVGSAGVKNLQSYNFTKAFMGTNGIDLQSHFTTPEVEEAITKQSAIEHSYITFILADHTKFGKVYPVTFSKLDKCCIITDKLTDKRYKDLTVVKELKK